MARNVVMINTGLYIGTCGIVVDESGGFVHVKHGSLIEILRPKDVIAGIPTNNTPNGELGYTFPYQAFYTIKKYNRGDKIQMKGRTGIFICYDPVDPKSPETIRVLFDDRKVIDILHTSDLDE